MTLFALLSRPNKPSPEAMTLGQHLGELRYRLIVSVSAFAAMAILAAFAYEPILHVLIRPLCAVATRPSCVESGLTDVRSEG